MHITDGKFVQFRGAVNPHYKYDIADETTLLLTETDGVVECKLMLNVPQLKYKTYNTSYESHGGKPYLCPALLLQQRERQAQINSKHTLMSV